MFTAQEHELRRLLEAVAQELKHNEANICELLDRIGHNVDPELLGWAHLCCAIVNGRHFEHALRHFERVHCREGVDIIHVLAHRYHETRLLFLLGETLTQKAQSLNRPRASRADVDHQFHHYCRQNNLAILRTLQSSRDDEERRASVYLVIDVDGIVKVFKESLSTDDWEEQHEQEGEIHEHLSAIHGLPRFYANVEVAPGVTFIRMEMVYGQTLLDFVREHSHVSRDEARFIVLSLARILEAMHARGYVYQDLRPQNVKIQGRRVRLLDLSGAKRCGMHEVVSSHLFDPRYSAPEMILRHEASHASDVFSLGALFFQLLTGYEPFMRVEKLSDVGGPLEQKILKFALPACVTSFAHELPDDHCGALIARMLNRDPTKRPCMAEVVQALSATKPVSVSAVHRRDPPRDKSSNCVLFPARMGLPHRGHIAYMTRMLELGFHLVIPIQRAYTSTHDDPYPKWIVAKMVAQSLIDEGFSGEHFTILLTPFFMTDTETRLYFALMPGRENVVAVASNNPTIWQHFPSLPIFTQQAVFGIEGKSFRVRSWGAILRNAVRTGNKRVFVVLVASGVEKIRTFDELRNEDNVTPIAFVHGVVRVTLTGNIEIPPVVVRQFDHPEDVVVKNLRARHEVEIHARWLRDTLLVVNRKLCRLVYQSTETYEKDILLRYALESV